MIGKTNASAGGGAVINGQLVDASVFLGSSISAGDFVSQITPPIQTVATTLYGYRDMIYLGDSRYLVAAGKTNANNLYFYLVNLQNNTFSDVDSASLSPTYSCSNILKISASEMYAFAGKYSSSSPRAYLFKISISGDTVSATQVATNDVAYSGYALSRHPACLLENGNMLCVNGYTTRTIITKVDYSGYALQTVNLGNINFSKTSCVYAGNNKVIINSNSGMRVIDCNASTPTSSDTFSYNSSYSNASNIVGLGNNYFATVMRESSSSANAELNIVRLFGDTISFVKNISITGGGGYSSVSYFDLLAADDGTLYHALFSGNKSIYQIKLDNNLNLSSYDLVFDQTFSVPTSSSLYPSIKLTQINGAVGLGYMDSSDSFAKFWQTGNNLVAPHADSVYGVAKSSGTSGQNIQVYIPNN